MVSTIPISTRSIIYLKFSILFSSFLTEGISKEARQLGAKDSFEKGQDPEVEKCDNTPDDSDAFKDWNEDIQKGT